MSYLATTTPKPGPAFVVSFEDGKTWRNLTWFGSTIYFKHERVARLVGSFTKADWISRYRI